VSVVDPFIDEGVRARIQAELDRIEATQQVRILLAVESGSRAWRFASPNSDYDVRFLYLRPLDEYLRIAEPRDVIERPLDAVLDINGWDLRKALQLMMKSNAVLLEWLTSPVRYRGDAAFCGRLLDLAREAAYPPALAFHYDRVAQRAWAPGEVEIRLKSYFYALRPALALRWMHERRTPPPMDLPSLREAAGLPDALNQEIDRLLALKARSDEAATIPRVPVVEAFLAEALHTPAPPESAPDRREIRLKADALFRDAVQDGGR
jgi:predicted nucleotidyltransferase